MWPVLPLHKIKASSWKISQDRDPNQDKLPVGCKSGNYKPPNKNILVTEDQDVKKKYKPFLKPQSF